MPAGAERPAGSFRIREVVDVGEYRRGEVKRGYRWLRVSRYRSGTYWVTKPRSEASLYIEGEILVEDGGGRHPTCTRAAIIRR